MEFKKKQLRFKRGFCSHSRRMQKKNLAITIYLKGKDFENFWWLKNT
jgi:hypothetical protein